MTENELRQLLDLFAPLHSDLTNMATITDRPNFLAHYTSLEVLEKIIQHNELWFSHPFFMNDVQEMRFGIAEGCKVFDAFSRHQEFIALCGTEVRAAKLASYFAGCLSAFELKNKFDVYVLCFSDHDDVADSDGLLSMWRGYGANGNGAALIFRTDYLRPREHSPLLAGKVIYATDAERRKWFEEMFRKGLKILHSESLPDDKLHVAAMAMFESMKVFALLSKHQGFKEEREWRIIYFPERDTLHLLENQISYFLGRRGIEPKLKFKVEPLMLEPRETWTFNSILHKIILGPSLSSELTVAAVCKMLVAHGKADFRGKLSASGIPLRSSAF
jgi:Protein of unknown function (DUF2971)